MSSASVNVGCSSLSLSNVSFRGTAPSPLQTLGCECFWKVAYDDPKMRASMVKNHRLGNFDTIRLVAAASVIFSHAFLIADGHDKNEPFVRLTGSIIGIHGVFIFLIISGFLVTQSLKTSSSLRHFAWKRSLRIYPALALCAIVSALCDCAVFL